MKKVVIIIMAVLALTAMARTRTTQGQLKNNSQVIVSQKPLKSVQDLKGKYVGCWKAGFSELAYSMDKQYKIGIKWIPFVSHVNLFVSKAIDATMAQDYNELFQLKLLAKTCNAADIGVDEMLSRMKREGFAIGIAETVEHVGSDEVFAHAKR